MDETAGTVEVNDAGLLRLVERDAPVERVCTGFRFSEGPIWNPREQCLYFSDMPGDVRRRWSPRDGVVEVRNPSNKCNGMSYDRVGNLYVCEARHEFADRGNARGRAQGPRGALAGQGAEQSE